MNLDITRVQHYIVHINGWVYTTSDTQCFRMLSAFLGHRDLTKKIIQDFVEHLHSQYVPKKKHGYNIMLRSLKRILRAHDLNYADEYKLIKVERSRYEILDEDEIKKVLEVAYDEDYRRALAVELTWRTGIRFESEGKPLKWKNVYEDGIFIEHSKTRESRFVLYTKDLFNKLQNLRGNHPTEVFSTNKGSISENKLNYKLKDWCKKAGIKKDMKLHWLRHSNATILDEKGIPTRRIQENHGHKNITTTQMYIHPTRKAMLEVARNMSLGNYKISFDEFIKKLDTVVQEGQKAKIPIDVFVDEHSYILKIRK